MKFYEFKDWLIKEKICTTRKQVSDCASRAKSVEKKFAQILGDEFDLDSEYDRDGLQYVRNVLSVYGKNKYMDELMKNVTENVFPIGNASMGGLNNAILKYQKFRNAQ